jgi:GNAT superfamily N-acetyltransferase
MNMLQKTVYVSIKVYEYLILVILFINGVQISMIKCVLQKYNSLLIGDIEPFIKDKYYNKGYGSLMMQKLLEYASVNGINTIHGNLSLADKDHEDRLHNFYEKLGFEIVVFKEPNDMFYGEVVKKL